MKLRNSVHEADLVDDISDAPQDERKVFFRHLVYRFSNDPDFLQALFDNWTMRYVIVEDEGFLQEVFDSTVAKRLFETWENEAQNG